MDNVAHLDDSIHDLVKRINITIYPNSPPGLIAASQEDPWSQAGKYSLGWVYFSLILLLATIASRLYYIWTDKMRRAIYKEELEELKNSKRSARDNDYEMTLLHTNSSTNKIFPRVDQPPPEPRADSAVSDVTPLNKGIALLRWFFYRPLPILRYKKHTLALPSPGVAFITSTAFIFVILYCFVPQPLYYATIRYGSPPLAIRAGMLSVAMIPLIIALSMKANMITMLTGIGHERLAVLHRWAAYICLVLALIHTIPFYITPVWDQGALAVFQSYFSGQYYIYGTGVAALVPLLFLCVHSLPWIRSRMYELFIWLHLPTSVLFIAMMFWHCNNYLTSWNYLWATCCIWVVSFIARLFFLNWTDFRKMSWLIGEEASITMLPENAVKVTIPTEVKWKPGQYVYLRMPGISIFENHPFTIASLCSDDFPSEYGEGYRDMILVFRPFSGFTRKCVLAAEDNGEWHTYRAFLDGPYGGMQRELASFDTVILFAGGSGITAIVSQLLDLIKKMRDERAVTKKVQVVWALKRPETLEWFKEELRICRKYAPPETVQCQFFITAAKRYKPGFDALASPNRPVSQLFHDKINDAFQGIASKRNSAYIREEAGGDAQKEQELRAENEDAISALPRAYIQQQPKSPKRMNMKPMKIAIPAPDQNSKIDFGFPTTPTMLQKNLMRFAFLPTTANKKGGWSTEYGRPDIPFMLRGFQREFGRRTCVFVCGPPSMRIDVQRCVARMQRQVLTNSGINEIYLHTENYAL
jgi:predicted ferric reductase